MNGATRTEYLRSHREKLVSLALDLLAADTSNPPGDTREIVFSGGLGSYLYGQVGSVNLGIVAPLLFGSALGARIGSAATAVVDADGIKIYFGGMLLVGAVAVGVGEIGSYIGDSTLELLGLVLGIGVAVAVALAILSTTISSLRVTRRQQASTTD